MEERRLRLGDIIDDYCPRERRLTNHAVVALVGDEVKQTRCTTCDAEHVYKQARVPARRKKSEAAALARPTDVRVAGEGDVPPPPAPSAAEPVAPPAMHAAGAAQPVAVAAQEEPQAPANEVEPAPEPAPAADDDWPVHRRLIRATLPRTLVEPAATRQAPDFTLRLPGARLGPLRDVDFGFKSPAPQKNGKKNGRPGRKPRGRAGADHAAHARNGNPSGAHGQHGQRGQQGPHGAHGRRGRHHGKPR